MTETAALGKIRRLAERRQALWGKAPALTATERAEISRLTAELEALWEQHRLELARSNQGPQRRAARPSRPAFSVRTDPAA